MAFLLALEGIDGSGKGTQAARLQRRFTERGQSAALLSFPRYSETFFGQAIGEFLNGRFGALEEVSPFLASLLYAGDRFESRSLLAEAADRHDVVVLDRYVPSNVAHQGAKLTGSDRQQVVDWIHHVEYAVYQLPCPDLIVLFDLPVAWAQHLIASKPRRAYTSQTADLQEADAAYLHEVRRVYQDLAQREPGWYRLEVVRGEELRSVEEIEEEIWTVIQQSGRVDSSGSRLGG